MSDRTTVPIRNLSVGQQCVLIEKMDGDEVRYTYYERSDHAPRYAGNVGVLRLRTLQGSSSAPARYDSGFHRSVSEVPKALPVMPISMP